ncbi:ACT domain-containing protein [Clostridium butyricum]|uniref:ACT domain-containing protein n=1 Tax=Clostridium butyricum TaxID=1492 RepID=UPI00374E7FF0
MKAILTVIGQDKVGIIARVSAKMLEFNINILDVNQTIMQDFFTMMMMLDCTNMKGNFDEVRLALTEEGKKLGVDIKIQREEIFKSMHSL